MKINKDRITRLMKLSKGYSHDPYERFEWPSSLPDDACWSDDELLTTYDTEWHERLSKEERLRLGKWEAVNFFSLNVHGIKSALEFISHYLYDERYRDVSEYLHVFVSEENFHMWYFAKTCLDYSGKIYPPIRFDNIENDAPDVLRQFQVFVSTLIFEEFVDYYNHKVGTTDGIAEILKQINYQHHVDETRHVSFGREIVLALYHQALAESDNPVALKEKIASNVTSMLQHFIALMYNPAVYDDARIYEPLGFRNAIALRNALRTHPARRGMHSKWFGRSAIFFTREGITPELDLSAL